MRTLPGEIFQVTLRGLARRHRFVRIMIFKLIKRKFNPAGKPHGFPDRLRHIAKQPCHFIGRLEIAFGIGFKTSSDGVDRGLLADAGQDILQRAARRMVIQHFIGSQQRHAGRYGNTMQPRKTAPVVAAVQQAGCKP